MLASTGILRQISKSVAMAVSCLLVGFSVLYYQQLYDFKRWSDNSASQAISIFDQALDYSTGINKKILELSELSCDDIRPILRDAVATTHYVRTVNIMEGDTIYCGSYSGDKNIYMPGDYLIKLVPGTPMMPTRSGLVVKTYEQNMAALSVIDAIYIKILLGMAMHNNELFIQIGDAWIDMSGTFLEDPPNLDNMHGIHKKSERYSYVVYAGHNTHNLLTYLIKNNIYVLALII